MKLEQLRKIIREEVRTAVKEELQEVFDKDFRTPIRLGGRLECGNLEIPDQCDETKLYYYPQEFMREDQYKSTMFYTNTRRKTQNDW